MNNEEFFNKLADKAGDWMGSGRYFTLKTDCYKSIFHDIINKIPIDDRDIVLDLGGGTGGITKYIAERCKHVILADFARTAIKKAEERLKDYQNVSFLLLDINDNFPSFEFKFDKIICYSVIHNLNNHEEFGKLIAKLLKITEPQGLIFFGDIPLSEKYMANLETRKFFLMDSMYIIRKNISNFIYFIKGINGREVKGISYTKDIIKNILSSFANIDYIFFEQDKRLPFANSREDLIIRKIL